MSNKAGRPSSTNKTSTTKTKTVEPKNKSKNEEIVETKIDTVEKSDIQEKVQRRQVANIDRNELIPCKSVVNGQLTYVSPRTQLQYVWSDYGSVEYIEFGELITMRSSKPKFMTHPWLLILDEEVVDYFRLNEMYNSLLPLDDINDFLKKPFKEIEAMFIATPIGMKKTFAAKIREMVEKEEISDIRIVSMIDKNLGTGLKEFI